MITVNSTVTGMSGRRYVLEKEIGSGGEGSVYAIKGCRLVAKLYKKISAGQEQKLLYMVYHHMPNLLDDAGRRVLTLAWPSDVLYDDSGHFIGYVMPLINGGIEIFEICRGCTSPKAKRMFPQYSWRLNVEVAKNLAVAVDYLHSQNCIIGDMNCKNILVNADGSVSILDTDSFDLTDPQTGTHFKCGAGTEDYLAPELQGRNLRQESSKFTIHSDAFALAIHIFQLLMDNYHPFNCRQLVKVKNSANANPRLEQICQGKSPYIRKYPDVDIPLGAPSLEEVLPQMIRLNFVRTFDYTDQTLRARIAWRTTPKKWSLDLDALLRECSASGGLSRCGDHEYLSSMHQCGKCRARKRYEDFQQTKSAPAASATPKPPQQTPASTGAFPGQSAARQSGTAAAPHSRKMAASGSASAKKQTSILSTLLRLYCIVFALVMLYFGFTSGEDPYIIITVCAIPFLVILRMEYFRRHKIPRTWAPKSGFLMSIYKLWLIGEHFLFLPFAILPPAFLVTMVTEQSWDPEMFWISIAMIPVAVNRLFYLMDVDS